MFGKMIYIQQHQRLATLTYTTYIHSSPSPHQKPRPWTLSYSFLRDPNLRLLQLPPLSPLHRIHNPPRPSLSSIQWLLNGQIKTRSHIPTLLQTLRASHELVPALIIQIVQFLPNLLSMFSCTRIRTLTRQYNARIFSSSPAPSPTAFTTLARPPPRPFTATPIPTPSPMRARPLGGLVRVRVIVI